MRGNARGSTLSVERESTPVGFGNVRDICVQGADSVGLQCGSGTIYLPFSSFAKRIPVGDALVQVVLCVDVNPGAHERRSVARKCA